MATEAATNPAGQGEAERQRSSILFPYNDLDSGVRVARGIHEAGGTSCPTETLAAHMGVKPDTGAFRAITLTSKIFGLVTYGAGSIQLTKLGQQICDKTQEKAARVEAFLTVPLYKAVYERFRGASLPPDKALEREMESLGVASKQTDKARQSFQRSAHQAGFFAYGQDKLVMPAGLGAVGDAKKQDETKKDDERRKGGDDGDGRHPFIAGLIKTLPDEGSMWTHADRGKWLQTAASIFGLIYKTGGDDKAVVTVTITDSTK